MPKQLKSEMVRVRALCINRCDVEYPICILHTEQRLHMHIGKEP